MGARMKPILGALVTAYVIFLLGLTYFFGPDQCQRYARRRDDAALGLFGGRIRGFSFSSTIG